MLSKILIVGLAATAAYADLDYSRTHIVDTHNVSSGITNWLFRSNFPKVTLNGTSTFAREELQSYMAKRATEAGMTLPSEFFFVDVSFDDPFESDYYLELDYFSKNPPNANLSEYLLVRALLPPQVRSSSSHTVNLLVHV